MDSPTQPNPIPYREGDGEGTLLPQCPPSLGDPWLVTPTGRAQQEAREQRRALILSLNSSLPTGSGVMKGGEWIRMGNTCQN